jgi:hypothetical protein
MLSGTAPYVVVRVFRSDGSIVFQGVNKMVSFNFPIL